MKIPIKSFDVEMIVASKGIEFEVRSPDGDQHIGDCFLTMTKLIWRKGRTTKANGVDVLWEDFMAICASKASLKAAIKAAKATP